MNNTIAVMAGNYNFSIVDIKEVKVGVTKTNIKVKFNNHVFIIYKAKTFEGSQEIDKLMDKYTEHKLSDYKVN